MSSPALICRPTRLRLSAGLATLLWLAGFVNLAGPAGSLRAEEASRAPAAAIASAHPLATQAGFEILEAGGNAFDAAVAVSATLAVVEPYGSGLGGGGFWLLHRAEDDYKIMLDGRERAPLAAHRDMYLDAQGKVVEGASVDGPRAAGIPGEPAALAHLAEHYGTLPLSRSLAPAVRAAREGFQVDTQYARMARFRHAALQRGGDAGRIFLVDGAVPDPGTLLKQPDLAATLERLARDGHDGFYRGEFARRLAASVREHGGIWSEQDLARYKVVERRPVRGRFRDLQIVSAAPPSSGGVVLMQMLQMLEPLDLARMSAVERVHLIAEVMRRAYRDRAQYLGDPDFVRIPLERLLHPMYAAGLRAAIRPDRATPSVQLPGVGGTFPGGRHTTHFSILDTDGNQVAATLSINYPFGAAFVPPGTGLLLNDEMDDFVAKPGVPNVYGLVGADANAIEPGKRPLSSMTPTFVEGPQGLAILGTPGGSRIITMVLLAILEYAHGADADAMVRLPRFHHQYLPDVIQFEPDALENATQRALRQRGHSLRALDDPYGNMQVVAWDKATGEVSAASDPRGIGKAEVAPLRPPSKAFAER